MSAKNPPGNLPAMRARLEQALAESSLAESLRRLVDTPARFAAARLLTREERLLLESQGNFCPDWSRLRIEAAASETGGVAHLATIRNNHFEGDVTLSGFHGEWPGPDGRPWPAGMANCRVRDAVIGNACVYDVTRLERQVIEDGAVVAGVGELDCPAPTVFSLGMAIHPGAETGTRSVWLFDNVLLYDCLAALTLAPAAQRQLQNHLQAQMSQLLSSYGFVGQGAAVLHARRVLSAWIGPGSRVMGASLIKESALMSAPDEPCLVADNAWVEHALLQPGSRVESGSKVSRTLLLEHSAVTWGGMVSQSVLGPDSQVSKGEMTACLAGPLVGFHHQSLLISALWPEGRGNIAYGANVGSNHTGKKPDQEIKPGEGNFFGLGTSIKFPANYEDAPYSLIATGVTTLPQKVAFPFSLITQPMAAIAKVPPAFNEIMPGWMWSENAYALVRRTYKGEDMKARRHDFAVDKACTLKGFFAGRIFTPSLARKVLRARQALKAAPASKVHYLEEQVPGLGKNFLRGKGLDKALAAYEDYLAVFLLRTFADRPADSWTPDLADVVEGVGKELGLKKDPKAFVAAQRGRLAALKENLLASLEREDKRGRAVFDDYADFHPPSAEDPALIRLDRELADLSHRLDAFLKGKPPS